MKSLSIFTLLFSVLLFSQCNNSIPANDEAETAESTETEETMELTNREKVVALLNTFNNGDTEPISYINPEKY
ncbi:MAG: hypothetical protein AAFY91_13155, partial [Bacteroidota bacterium]